MRGTVHLQVSCLREAAPTHLTAECPQARVDKPVAAQVGRRAEVLPAGVAGEGLLASVNSAVH